MTEEDEKTVVNQPAPELLEELRGDPVMDVDPKVLKGLTETLETQEPPDFTVTHSAIRTAWSREYTKGFVIQWGTKSAGFGELTFYQLEDGRLQFQNEGMSADFCKRVLTHLLESAWEAKFGTPP